MAKNSRIEWTDHTWNPWIGCTHVSEGCRNCYAERDFDKRRHVAEWGPGKARVRTSENYWHTPISWNRKAEKDGTRPRVFCASLADWLDPEVHLYWFGDLLKLIRQTPNLDWLLLTKRPEEWENRIKAVQPMLNTFNPGRVLARVWERGEAPPNVWIGTTVENQKAANERIPHLMSIPARVRFLSCEPLLGPLDLTPAFVNLIEQVNTKTGKTRTVDLDGAVVAHAAAHARKLNYCDPTRHKSIEWVICGGESGPGARPMHPDWARGLRDQCQAAGVAFHFKQWGSYSAVYDRDKDPDWCEVEHLKRKFPKGRWVNLEGGHGFHGERLHWMVPGGVKAAGRLLDGREWNELPEVAS